MHPGSYNVIRWKDGGFLKPMDPSRIANWPHVFDSLKNMNMANIDGDQYYIPSEFGNSSIVYRTDLVDAKYQGDGESWGIFTMKTTPAAWRSTIPPAPWSRSPPRCWGMTTSSP